MKTVASVADAAFAQRLMIAQAPLNQGRGVAAARSVAALLAAGRRAQAAASVRNEFDKLDSHPTLVRELAAAGLLVEVYLP